MRTITRGVPSGLLLACICPLLAQQTTVKGMARANKNNADARVNLAHRFRGTYSSREGLVTRSKS
jgi:hypothetical protein